MAKRVLVIDDDTAILEVIGSILSYEDYDVKTSVTPQDLDADLSEFNPHLILLDINLGSFNGLQICRTLKANPGTKHIPVVILSADDSIFDAIQIFGANDIILKPLDMNVLLEIVGRYLLAPVIQLHRF